LYPLKSSYVVAHNKYERKIFRVHWPMDPGPFLQLKLG
jgi:hypothetical protein